MKLTDIIFYLNIKTTILYKNIFKLILKMESGLTMVLHSVIIGILLYLIMIYILGQKQIVAEKRSIVLASLVLIYMILFGHGMPTSINKNLF